MDAPELAIFKRRLGRVEVQAAEITHPVLRRKVVVERIDCFLE
jgi:hypothetical protein